MAAATSAAVEMGWDRARSATCSRSSMMKPVSTGPGDTMLNFTPELASSMARARLKARRPNLVAEYTVAPGVGVQPAREATWTTDPLPCARR